MPAHRTRRSTLYPLRWVHLAVPLIFLSCAAGGGQGTPGPEPTASTQGVDATADGPQESPTPGPPASAIFSGVAESSLPWADHVLSVLPLRGKVAQLMMPMVLGTFSPEGTDGHDRILEWVREEAVGGVIVSVGSPTDVAVKLNDLQRHAVLPLLVGADLEAGAGFRFFGAVHTPTNIVLGGATAFPSIMALGAVQDPSLAYEMGRITAIEARAIGVHIPFAPVLDVNNNSENPIINIRSFGERPEDVALLGSAVVRGIQDYGGVATGKHFPGHGDTGVDSHLALPIIEANRARLDSVELVPFQAAIRSGMRGIMTAHIAVPELTGSSVPSTLSAAILTDLLRHDLNFGGLIFTDAMDMSAIDRLYGRGEASVRAIEAGADVLLMPPNVPEAIDAIVAAVESGRISESRIDASVIKLLRLKDELKLQEHRTVPLEEIPRVVGIPEHTEVAAEIARRSLTLIRNERNLLPLLGTRRARVLSLTIRGRNDLLGGRYFNSRLRATYPRLVSAEVDADTNPAVFEGLSEQAGRSNLVVVSIYSNFSGRLDIADEALAFVDELASRGIPHMVISFGNPYVIKDFPQAQAYMLAWSGVPASQRAAAAALFGEFDITGRSPIGMEGFFAYGDGLMVPAKELAGGDGR